MKDCGTAGSFVGRVFSARQCWFAGACSYSGGSSSRPVRLGSSSKQVKLRNRQRLDSPPAAHLASDLRTMKSLCAEGLASARDQGAAPLGTDPGNLAYHGVSIGVSVTGQV